MIQRILVVDDDEPVARALRRDLESAIHGAVVDAVYDGASAVALLEQRDYDACIIDWMMNPVPGVDVIKAARARSCPSVVLSGYMDVRNTVEAMKFGAENVLEKPVHLASLLEALPRPRSSRLPGSVPDDQDLPSLLLGVSPPMTRARHLLERFAGFPDVPVLITGETGSGKGVAARHLHSLAKPGRPFVAVNCAAIPETLLESELFGHEAGAFTSAKQKREGLLEAAQDGSLFLDEVGDMSRALQAKLLNVLEEGVYRRLGSNHEQKLRARVIAATNAVVTGPDSALREDLYFRLAGCSLRIPPLRERPEDIDILGVRMLRAFCQRHAKPMLEVSRRALEALHAYEWPGNVRELRRVIECAAVYSTGGVISADDVTEALENRLSPPAPAAPEWAGPTGPAVSAEVAIGDLGASALPIRELERRRILQTFRDSGENVSMAARQLGLPRSTLRDKLRRYGVG